MADKGSEDKSHVERNVPKWLLTARGIVVVVIGIFTAWNTYFTEVTKNQLERQAAELDNTIKRKVFENELRFKVFEEVKNAISKPDSNLQEVVRLMIEEVLNEDSTFQEKMKNILLASNNTASSVKTDIKLTEQYNEEQKEIIRLSSLTTASERPTPAVTERGNNRIDVFYLDDKANGAMDKASRVVDLLKRKYPQSDIRVRLLPSTINARQGYRIDANQIRHEQSEHDWAGEIRKVISDASIIAGKDLHLHAVGNKTPNYLSVFVVDGR